VKKLLSSHKKGIKELAEKLVELETLDVKQIK
jgi:ATP-dependent Zn protease